MQQEAKFPSEIPTVEQLFKRYQPMLFRRAFRLVDEEDVAKDLVQNVFLQLWKNRETIDFGPAIQGYLFKATTHAALNYLDSNKRKRFLHQQILRQSSHETTGGTETLAFQELQTNIQQAIERLPPKCKVIFLLSRQEGLPYKQIAEQLDLSLKTVENQMGIALEKLREDLKPFLPRELVLLILLLAHGLGAW
ncbi:MAG: RNA polymerase sigma-70 factor [Bacteroidota bacterium]